MRKTDTMFGYHQKTGDPIVDKESAIFNAAFDGDEEEDDADLKRKMRQMPKPKFQNKSLGGGRKPARAPQSDGDDDAFETDYQQSKPQQQRNASGARQYELTSEVDEVFREAQKEYASSKEGMRVAADTAKDMGLRSNGVRVTKQIKLLLNDIFEFLLLILTNTALPASAPLFWQVVATLYQTGRIVEAQYWFVHHLCLIYKMGMKIVGEIKNPNIQTKVLLRMKTGYQPGHLLLDDAVVGGVDHPEILLFGYAVAIYSPAWDNRRHLSPSEPVFRTSGDIIFEAMAGAIRVVITVDAPEELRNLALASSSASEKIKDKVQIASRVGKAIPPDFLLFIEIQRKLDKKESTWPFVRLPADLLPASAPRPQPRLKNPPKTINNNGGNKPGGKKPGAGTVKKPGGAAAAAADVGQPSGGAGPGPAAAVELPEEVIAWAKELGLGTHDTGCLRCGENHKLGICDTWKGELKESKNEKWAGALFRHFMPKESGKRRARSGGK
jgi:hypothetical protein